MQCFDSHTAPAIKKYAMTTRRTSADEIDCRRNRRVAQRSAWFVFFDFVHRACIHAVSPVSG